MRAESEVQSPTSPYEPALQLLQTLESMPVLTGVSAVVLKRFAQASELRRYMRNDEVFGIGSAPTGLFFVVEGCVQLMTPNNDGRKRVVELFETGAMFGEIGVLRQEPFQICAQATDRTVLVHVDIATVRSTLDYDLGLTRRLLNSMADRSMKLIGSIGTAAPLSTDARIAAYLCDLSESEGRCGGSLVLPTRKAIIASMLNMNPESLSRSLRRLADKGIMQTNGRRILVLDWLGLARVAHRSEAA